MFIDDEPVIAQCPLEQGQRDKNCYLSYEKLMIVISGRTHKFELVEINQLSFKHKLLLLPVISGGICTPLSLIAILNDVLNLWLMLVMFMIGLLLAYYGLVGRNTLSISTLLKEYDYFINSPSQNLKAFLRFVMKIKDQKGQPRYYLSIPSEFLASSNKVLYLDKDIELFESPPRKSKTAVFIIEPLRSAIQVTYQSTSDGKVVPYVTGKISRDDLLPFPSKSESNL